MKVQIAPSLLACDLARLKDEIQAVEAAGADLLHLDIMDGHFVPNITFGLPVIEKIRSVTKLPLDAHLMIENADQYIEDFHKAGCDWISVHVEACPHLNRTLNTIRSFGKKAGVAINPGTSLAAIDAALSDIDYVLVMSVNPGFGGQSFLQSALDRVRTLRKKLPTTVNIQIDGGIKEENTSEVVKAGADVLVVGTGIFRADDYAKKVAAIKSAAAN